MLERIVPAIKVAAFHRNQRYAAVPFAATIEKSLRGLANNAPIKRSDVAHSFAAASHACGEFYAAVAKDYLRELLRPVVIQARMELPSFLRFRWFDTSTEVPNFVYVNAWRQIHRDAFFESTRYRVVYHIMMRLFACHGALLRPPYYPIVVPIVNIPRPMPFPLSPFSACVQQSSQGSQRFQDMFYMQSPYCIGIEDTFAVARER